MERGVAACQHELDVPPAQKANGGQNETWPFGEIARGELLTVQIRRDGWASGGWGVPPQTPRDSKRRQEAGPHRGLPRQGGVRSEGHVSVRCVYRPRMQALTTRSKSLAFQQSDIPGKNLQLTQRPQRHSSPRHTRRPTASPRSSPTPRPELLRPPRAASPSRLAAALRLELRHLLVELILHTAVPPLVAPPPHRARAPPPAPSCFAVTLRRRTAPRTASGSAPAPPPPRRAHAAHSRE